MTAKKKNQSFIHTKANSEHTNKEAKHIIQYHFHFRSLLPRALQEHRGVAFGLEHRQQVFGRRHHRRVHPHWWGSCIIRRLMWRWGWRWRRQRRRGAGRRRRISCEWGGGREVGCCLGSCGRFGVDLKRISVSRNRIS